MYYQIVVKISILLQICFEREFAKTKLFSLDFSTRFKNFYFSFIKTILPLLIVRITAPSNYFSHTALVQKLVNEFAEIEDGR